MTKEVIIKIKGLQFMGEPEGDEMEVITAGNFFEKNGRCYVKYDEVVEGMEGTIQNLLKFDDQSLEVTKKGITNVHMIFEENKKNMTYYETPFGNLLIGISATRIQMKRKKEEIDLEVDYALEINYEHMADCQIMIEIQSKNKKEAHLLS